MRDISTLQDSYIPERIAQIDKDFLSFEEDLATDEDLAYVIKALGNELSLPNPYNSCILYTTGLTDVFDFKEARAMTIGGSPPDIDMDFDALERQKAIDWVTEKWGRNRVASIMTHGKFKIKSTIRDFFRVTRPLDDLDEQGRNQNAMAQLAHDQLEREIASEIPNQQYGKEPSLEEVLDGNKDKGYAAHPELRTDERFKPWLDTALWIENMVKQFGIHAGGIVISDKDIREVLPIWWKKHKEKQSNGTTKTIEKWITQYDMGEVEELGLIKFDFLSIDNISVLKECCRLITERHNIDINPFRLKDHDEKAYLILSQGLLTGIFQMETSGSAKRLIKNIKPSSINEI